MAVLAYQSARYTMDRPYPIDDHGKHRWQVAKFTAVGVGDASSTIDFFDLPTGRTRIILPEIKVRTSAFGASRVLKLGHRAYQKVSTPYTNEAEDDDAFFSALDISAGGNLAPTVGGLWFDIFAETPVTIFGTVTGGTVPDAATISLMVPYIYE